MMKIDKSYYKIVFFGLYCSGKSTIVQYMTSGIIPSQDDGGGTPTIDYNRSLQIFDDNEITLFDLGGAAYFLDHFVGELSEFMFKGVKTFVFVVDSTEIEHLNDLKYYFASCREKINQYCPEASLFIFQHKVDLISQDMRSEVSQTIKDYLLEGNIRSVSYYETSVFDGSLIDAISAVYQDTLGYIPPNWFLFYKEPEKIIFPDLS